MQVPLNLHARDTRGDTARHTHSHRHAHNYAWSLQTPTRRFAGLGDKTLPLSQAAQGVRAGISAAAHFVHRHPRDHKAQEPRAPPGGLYGNRGGEGEVLTYRQVLSVLPHTDPCDSVRAESASSRGLPWGPWTTYLSLWMGCTGPPEKQHKGLGGAPSSPTTPVRRRTQLGVPLAVPLGSSQVPFFHPGLFRDRGHTWEGMFTFHPHLSTHPPNCRGRNSSLVLNLLDVYDLCPPHPATNPKAPGPETQRLPSRAPPPQNPQEPSPGALISAQVDNEMHSLHSCQGARLGGRAS